METNHKADQSSAGSRGSVRASVRLSVRDWNDLVNFVNGDLANMDENDETRLQMNRILDAIRIACMKAPNGRDERPGPNDA